MSFFAITLSLLALSLSSLTSAGDLIANLNYGDTRETATRKLKNSPLLKANIADNLFGRVGLNGSFTTTRDLAGLKFSLYFDWSESRELQQITFRSDALPDGAYDQRLKTSWTQASNLLSSMHGATSNAGEYPKQSEIKPGTMRYSHEWKTHNGYIYLGTGQETKGYSLVITFSEVSLDAQ
ncbi:MAG: hypothetical protein ACSHX6_07610 [Akkermansiaceae bacterium]